MFAFPALLFAILASATLAPSFVNTFGPEGRLILVSIALGITVWPQMARFVRGQTLQLKEQQFVEAARMSGSSNQRIMVQHIVPNLFSIVVAAATLDMVGTIIAEATLSLLDLGVEPPGSSLGLMISDGVQRLYINAQRSDLAGGDVGDSGAVAGVLGRRCQRRFQSPYQRLAQGTRPCSAHRGRQARLETTATDRSGCLEQLDK